MSNFIWRDKQRLGRFFKHTDPVLKVVTVTDFSLEEICETSMTIPDNTSGSIINVNLHAKEMIDSGVRIARDLSRDLSTPDTRRMVLRPLDFTDEWRRMKARQQGRSRKHDEEEEIEIELEMARRRRKDNGEGASDRDLEDAPLPDKELNGTADEDSIEAHATNQDSKELSSPLRIKKSFETVTDAIEKLTPEVSRELNESHFKPLTLSREGENVEQGVVDEYHEDLVERRMVAAADGAVVEEAKRRGYEEGFRSGEAQALDAAKLQAVDNRILIAKLAAELETKKREVLANAQGNFHDVAEALVSGLLQREFRINPEVLAGVVNRAITETVTDDQFTVHMHPQTLAAMIPFLEDRLKSRVTASDSIAMGEFKIETKLSMVDGKITQIVKDLLSQADLELFDFEAKVS